MSDFIQDLIKLGKSNKIEKIEEILEDKLEESPDNIDLLLRLAVLELAIPLVDFFKSIKFLERIFKLEEEHPIALLLLAYIHYYEFYGFIDEKLKDRLVFASSDSKEVDSMLKYTASLFYLGNGDIENQEKLLDQSIKLYDGHVWNYVHLAQVYFKQGKNTQARDLLKKALKNIQAVYPDESLGDDITDVNDFLTEYIKGTYLSDVSLASIQKMMKK